MDFLISILISAFVMLVAVYLVPGAHLSSFWTALAVAIVLGIINFFLKPILIVLTLPVNIVTLGLFTFVINALLLLLAAAIVPGFRIDSFWWALLLAIVLALLNWLVNSLRAA
jgi:putative membrane protein